jgi:hypothetical protein
LAALLLTEEFDDRNLRPGADTDREGDGADAAVDVKLSVALLESSTDLKAFLSAQPRKVGVHAFKGWELI